MGTREIQCAAGHSWEWEIKRGRVPRFCPLHNPANQPKEPVYREIECKAGHKWSWEVKKGRVPYYCPEHHPDNQVTSTLHTSEEPKKRTLTEEHKQKLLEGKRKKEEGKLGRIIDEVLLTSPSAKLCRCGLHNEMTWTEIMALGSGCTAGQFVCPTLDSVRRRMGH